MLALTPEIRSAATELVNAVDAFNSQGLVDVETDDPVALKFVSVEAKKDSMEILRTLERACPALVIAPAADFMLASQKRAARQRASVSANTQWVPLAIFFHGLPVECARRIHACNTGLPGLPLTNDELVILKHYDALLNGNRLERVFLADEDEAPDTLASEFDSCYQCLKVFTGLVVAEERERPGKPCAQVVSGMSLDPATVDRAPVDPDIGGSSVVRSPMIQGSELAKATAVVSPPTANAMEQSAKKCLMDPTPTVKMKITKDNGKFQVLRVVDGEEEDMTNKTSVSESMLAFYVLRGSGVECSAAKAAPLEITHQAYFELCLPDRGEKPVYDKRSRPVKRRIDALLNHLNGIEIENSGVSFKVKNLDLVATAHVQIKDVKEFLQLKYRSKIPV